MERITVMTVKADNPDTSPNGSREQVVVHPVMFGLFFSVFLYSAHTEYFDIIVDRPLSFEAVDFIRKGYRRCVCGSDSIYYRINNDVVEIMTIIGRQHI